METEGLSAVCAGLGIAQEDENGIPTGYIKGECCLENLKDLQRFLRRDNPQTRDVFKQVCKWNTVSHDLIPIIEHYQIDRDLVITSVKILVYLTMPIDPTSDGVAQQIEYLWGLKESVTRNDAIAVIVSLIEDPLEHLEREAFTEDDWKLVQLVLTLFRNLLSVQDISLQQKASGSTTQIVCLRERFLELLFSENVMDLILALAPHVAGSNGYLRQDNLLLLEIFHYIFFGQEPELIAKASRRSSKVDGDVKASLNFLRSVMEEEEEKRKLTRQQKLDRHSKFSGTFVRFAVDGSKVLCKGNPATIPAAHNVQRGRLKQTVWENGNLTYSNERILVLLYDFANQFISAGYSILMQSIRSDIEKDHHAIQSSDIVIFFQVAHFLTAFQRHKFSNSKHAMMGTTASEVSSTKINADGTQFLGDICGPIAATMNEAMFLLVISKWRYAFDALKETKDYKFLSAAGSLMKEMIRMLDLVLKLFPEDAKEAQTARILLYKIFYDQTDQGLTQFLVNLIRSFDTHKQPKSDLADLVEVIHVVLRLMENLQARGTLRVSRKSRKRRKKKFSEKGRKAEGLSEEHGGLYNVDEMKHAMNPNSEPFIDGNTSKEGNSSSVVQGESSLTTNPVGETEMPLPDTANLVGGESSLTPNPVGESEMPLPDTENFFDGESRCENPLSDVNNPGDGGEIRLTPNRVGIYETLLPDAAILSDGGESSLSPNLVRDPEMPVQVTTNSGDRGEKSSKPKLVGDSEMLPPDTAHLNDGLSEMENKNSSCGRNDQAYESDESCEDDEAAPVDEIDLNVSKVVATFACNTAIHNLCWLLNFYKGNSVSTNHYIICMLRRICDDLELSPMLYQISFLITFYNILVDQKKFPCEEYKNIVSFLTKLVRKLLRKMKSQPLLFVEILFWKTTKECHLMNSDFLLHELGNLKKEIRNWESVSADVGDGEIGSADGKEEWLPGKSLADALGEDEADIMDINYHKEDPSDEKLQKVLKKGKNCVGIMNKRSESISVENNEKIMNSGEENRPEEGHSLEHELHRARKRRKKLDFDHEGETNLRTLFEKYKDSLQCSRLIAEALDPDGKVSPVQVTFMLKKLGLKVTSRKKKLQSDELSPVGGQVRDKNQNLNMDTNSKNMNKLDDASGTNISSHPRKRIRAFSKEQEQRVKELFEQFKTHRRCSQMIADALDENNMYSATQVSRKLKQLGLRNSRQKGSQKVSKISAHETVEDSLTAEIAEQSDEETLLIAMRRRKNTGVDGKGTTRVVEFNSKMKRSPAREDNSDDEILSSILAKNRKKISHKTEDKLMTSLVGESVIDNDTTGDPQQVIQSDACGQGEANPLEILPHLVGSSSERLQDQQTDSRIADGFTDMDDDSNAELDDDNSIKQAREPVTQKVDVSNNEVDLPHQQTYDEVADELDDSDDEVRTVVSKHVGARRKLKIVSDDDE